MPTLIHHGLHIYYREERPPRRAAGGRPTLIFLPGNTASSANLGSELRYFGHRFRCLALDPPGTGRSERLTVWPADRWMLTAGAVAALMGRLDLGPAVLVGSSGGGIVALLLALERSDLVAGVVADSCPPQLRTADLRAQIAARRELLDRRRDEPAAVQQPRSADSLGGFMRRRSLAWFWRRAHGPDWPAVVEADTEFLERLVQDGDHDPFNGHLDQVRCPVLLSGSLEDDVIRDLGARLEEMALTIPDCRLFLWPEGAHPLMWSAPVPFRRAVDDFLVDLADPTGTP
jgi:pimeloyl-ACP methyl ester carboxylesterase